MHSHMFEQLDHNGHGVANNHHGSIIQYRRPYLVLDRGWMRDRFDKLDFGGCKVGSDTTNALCAHAYLDFKGLKHPLR